jgi:hypothetical protein
MHIFLMRGDLLYSIVLMVVSTNYHFILPANAYIELCTPRLSGKPSAESSLFAYHNFALFLIFCGLSTHTKTHTQTMAHCHHHPPLSSHSMSGCVLCTVPIVAAVERPPPSLPYPLKTRQRTPDLVAGMYLRTPLPRKT